MKNRPATKNQKKGGVASPEKKMENLPRGESAKRKKGIYHGKSA